MPITITANFRLGSTMQSLARLQRGLDAATAKANALTSALLQAGAAANTLSGGLRSAGTGTTRASSPTRSSRPPAFNPFQNNPQAGMAYFARGAVQGNPFAARMYGRYSGQYNSLRRNQANAQNYMRAGGAQNPAAAMIAQAVGSTRFGRGGGQVLGHVATALLGTPGGSGILQGLLGPGGAVAGSAIGGGAGLAGAATIAGPLAAAAVGLKVFAEALDRGGAQLAAWNQALVSGGGSFRQAQSSVAFGSALGVNLPGVGANLGGYAAARLGLNPVSGPFGDMNFNRRALRALEDIRKSTSFDAARRKAMLAGDISLASAYNYTSGTFNLLRNPGRGSKVFSKTPDQYQGAKAAFQNEAGTFFANNTGASFAAAAGAFESLAKTLKMLNDLQSSWQEGALKWLKGLDPHGTNKYGWGARPPGARDSQEKAMRDNTDALNANTNAYQQGMFGGGGRSAGAIPNGMNSRMTGVPNSAARRAAYGII
jgi:hypothetical protein